MKTIRSFGQPRAIALTVGLSALMSASGAFASDVVTFSRATADQVSTSQQEDGANAVAANTYNLSALNDELRATLTYVFYAGTYRDGEDRWISSYVYTSASGKVFNYDGETLTAMVQFTGQEGPSATEGKVEATVWRDGNVLDSGAIGSQGTLWFNQNVLKTGKLDLLTTAKDFSIGGVTVSVKANVTGTVVVPIVGTVGPRGVNGSITPTASLFLDASASAGIGPASVGMKASHVDLMSLSLPANVNAGLSGACISGSDCHFDLHGSLGLNLSSLKGKLDAYATVPIVSQSCGWNLQTALFPIWSCVGIPSSKTSTKTIWDSPGFATNTTLWSTDFGADF